MKKKLLLTIALIFTLVCILAVTASAASYTINYDGKATAQTDENGTITLRDTQVNNLSTTKITDADGNEISVTQEFFGWYTDDGRVFAPGETVTFTEDTYLRDARGKAVDNYHDLDQMLGRGWWYIRLEADLTLTSQICTERTGRGAMCILDLNGHTITTSSKNAFGAARSGIRFVGEGTIIHTGSGHLFETARHGYGDGNQRVFIGKDVTVSTNGSLFNTTNDLEGTDGIFEVRIYGNATAKNLATFRKLKNASTTIYEGGSLTLTGDKMFVFSDTTGGEHYMTLTLGGNIKFTNPDSSALFNDFMLTRQFTVAEVTNGSFTVSSTDAECIAMFLPDTLMLKATENEDGTTTYNVAPADCVHEWVLNEEQSTSATLTETGVNVFNCSKCGTSKSEITVYSPENAEIKIVVDTGDGERTITALAGDVLDLQFSGTGAAALCTLYGLKDTAEFTADQIIEIEIPAGVAVIGGFTNSTLRVINIADGVVADIISTVVQLKGLKTINIGEATVEFVSGLASSTIETISSKVAGATVTFGNTVFKNGKNIKTLEMCAGSTYTFGVDSFRLSGLTELIFPDNSTISWNTTSFAECQQLEYIYFGSNIGVKEVKNGAAVFDGISNLKKVIIMDLTYLGEWAFSTKAPGKDYGPLCDLTMYIHSEDLTMHANAFNTRNGPYHVFIYTVQTTLPTTINNCNRVTYHGIGHAYTEQVITPSTCVTPGKFGYATDCPCGIDYRENSFTVACTYDSSLDGTFEPYGTDEKDLPLSTEHTNSDIVCDVTYENGLTELGKKNFKCLYCDVVASVEETASFPAIFLNVGYSYSLDSKGGIIQSFAINRQVLSDYEEITGRTIKYGLVAAVKSVVNTTELITSTGEASAQKIASVAYENRDYDMLSMKITGLATDYADLEVFCQAYYVLDSDVFYIDNGAVYEEAQTTTYNNVVTLVEPKATE